MPLMHHRIPYVGAISIKLVLQPDISLHCKTMYTG